MKTWKMAERRVAVPAIGVGGKQHLEPAYFCILVSEHKTKASKHSDQTGGDVDKHNKMFLWRLFFSILCCLGEKCFWRMSQRQKLV